jgi:hypothetical protein
MLGAVATTAGLTSPGAVGPRAASEERMREKDSKAMSLIALLTLSTKW